MAVDVLTQDWEPVVIRKKAPTAAAKKDEKAINAARRMGAEIDTIKKFNADSYILDYLSDEICSSEADVVTINDCPENIVGILVPYGSERRLLKEKASGEKWYWRRERDGWPDLANVASDGENMVADEELEIKVFETSWRVRAIATKPELKRLSGGIDHCFGRKGRDEREERENDEKDEQFQFRH
ncbi:hypothetical protein F0562_007983 [Nyssa sinensis]|uniref:Multiprotein bridging factor 1 N-terminal domain-containing protein n=1 Tax=Nyssa sinensis TaxID=561372 RepID=A0A5J5A935_9ASTE|nr:hypothetical protein F0562_007983 [Nyssa sinensis]